MYSPTGGQAEINGHSISSDMTGARQSLGLCPQHNMLFTDLTVYEHLMIFAMVDFLNLFCFILH
jgi:ATP-binding cassette subfamily A (ABC1) protein 3